MSHEADDFKHLTKWGVVAGVAGYIVFAIALVLTASGLVVNGLPIIKGNVTVWFFFVTVLGAYLVADVVTAISDKIASFTTRQVFIFHKFLGFALSILAGAVAGEYLYKGMLEGLTNTPLSVGVFIAVVIIVLLPVALLGDFFFKGKYRFANSQKLTIGLTKDVMAMLEAERKKMMLRSIPETIRYIVSEYLSKDKG